MKASQKYLKISYKKLNVVADLVRGKSVMEAAAFLKFAPKKAADLLLKMVLSATANAEQKGMKKEDLVIGEIKVTKGALYKRWRPVSRGRAHGYRKATSNCIVILAEKKTEKKKMEKKVEKKVEKKPTPKKTEKKVIVSKTGDKKEEKKGTTSKVARKAKIISKNKSK